MYNNRNLYDFDGVIYRGNCSLDFFTFCLKYYPGILKYVPKYVLDYLLIKTNRFNYEKDSYDFCKFICDVKDLELLILKFWKLNILRINKWYLEQHKKNDLIISGSPDFLLKYICDYLGVENISTVVDINNGYVTDFCYRDNKIMLLNDRYPNEIFDSFYTDNLSDDKSLFDKVKNVYYVKSNCRFKIK